MEEKIPTSTPDDEPVYPLPAPPDDSRFSNGLMLHVADVLAEHGYPPLTHGNDLVRLMVALYRFLYRPTDAGPPVEYGHDRIDNVDEAAAVPTGVDGESMTGRPAETQGRPQTSA